jgi:hypothetical protein
MPVYRRFDNAYGVYMGTNFAVESRCAEPHRGAGSNTRGMPEEGLGPAAGTGVHLVGLAMKIDAARFC